MEYLRITESDELPDLASYKPFKCVVLNEDEVSIEKQAEISDRLCDSGCLFNIFRSSESQ